MASRRIDASRLWYATPRYVSRWIGTPSRIWNATWWSTPSRLPLARISTASTWISTVSTWIPLANAWLYASAHAWSYAYAPTHARYGSRCWICPSSCTNGCPSCHARVLPSSGRTDGYQHVRCSRKAYASQNYQPTLLQMPWYRMESCKRQAMWKMRLQKVRWHRLVSSQKQAMQKDEA